MTTSIADHEQLTDKQRAVFLMLWDGVCRDGFQPAIRDIMENRGFRSPNAVMVHFRAIAHKGWIALGANHSRSARSLRNPDGSPFRGFVAAPEA